MTEELHQMLLMNWARKMAAAGREECGLLLHIPNGGLRSKSEAAKLKMAGVQAGVPDLFLPVPVIREYEGIEGRRIGPWWSIAGLWIELKEPGKGKVSPEQNKWLLTLLAQGYAARVAWGWEEAVGIVKGYLGGEWPEVDLGTWANGVLGTNREGE